MTEVNPVAAPEDLERVQVSNLYSGVISIDLMRHYMHHGVSFRIDALGLAGLNGTVIVAFKTPNGENHISMRTSYQAPLDGTCEIWECAKWTTGTGSRVNAINLRRPFPQRASRISEDSSGSAVENGMVLNPTGLDTSGATLLSSSKSWGQLGTGFLGDGDCDLILAPNACYAARFTSAKPSNECLFHFQWFEHLDYVMVEL